MARPLRRGRSKRGLFRPVVIVKRVRLSSKRLSCGRAVADRDLELSINSHVALRRTGGGAFRGRFDD
jgi:hypothetical protein